MRQRIYSRKGFTLAELLVVVAVIGILVSISIPVFQRQLEKSREATDIIRENQRGSNLPSHIRSITQKQNM